MTPQRARRISLSAVLDAHDAHCKVRHSIADNLGDGYLFQRYSLVRRLREGVIALGYQLTTRDRRGHLC